MRRPRLDSNFLRQEGNLPRKEGSLLETEVVWVLEPVPGAALMLRTQTTTLFRTAVGGHEGGTAGLGVGATPRPCVNHVVATVSGVIRSTPIFLQEIQTPSR